MSVLIVFIQKAIVQGICILYGALGEIMTEKSGNLNLGIPGIMYMGGISGLMGAFLYEKDNPDPNALVGVLISFLCAFACAAIGGLIYSILTITLRVNQNVTGLALTIFGTGFGNFFGGSISKLAGGVGQISVQTTAAAFRAKIPGLSAIPFVGDLLFSYGFLTYLSVGLLSVFVTPNKDASLAFLFFFGYFPLLRNGMERFRWKFLGFLLRLAVFNAAVLAFFWVSVFVLGMKELLESLGDYGK